MGTVHELSVKHNSNFERAVESVAIALRKAIDVAIGTDADFAMQEKFGLEITNGAVREVLQDALQDIADSHPDEVEVNGWHYRRHQAGTGTYHSLCGPLHVERWSYRRTDLRNGPTVIPLELEAGLVERCTPALAYSIALGYSRGPMRDYEEEMHGAHRQPPTRATLERLAKTIGTEVKRSVIEIEPAVRRKEQLPEGAFAICIGLDRTSSPMEERRPDGVRPNSRRKKRRKPYRRKPPPPVDVHYRMPYVCTVTVVDEDGEPLTKRSYATTAADGPEDVLGRMVEDVRWATAKDTNLKVAVIMDGADELWHWITDTFRNLLPGVSYYKILDFYHYLDRLAKALEFVERDQAKRNEHLEYWADRLQRFQNAPLRLEQWLGSLTPHRKGTEYHQYRDHVRYLSSGYKLTEYARFRKLNLPIGSGVTEGACKHLIAARTKRSGQRWHNKGLGAVLTLRAMHHSERLPTFWNFFKRNYKNVVRPAA